MAYEVLDGSLLDNLLVSLGKLHATLHKRKNDLWPINVKVVVVVNDAGVLMFRNTFVKIF